MLFLPGILISILTFPGVIVHEIAHQFFCRIFRVAVFDVCYFRIGNPAGYVIHEIPRKKTHQILIGIGPFFINTILGAIIGLPSALSVINFGVGTFIDYFLIWLGVSIAMHSFPSTGDAKTIWKAVWKEDTSFIVKLIAAPIIGFIYVCAAGSVVLLDLYYGMAVVAFIPNLILKIFA